MTLVRWRPASLSPVRDLIGIHDEMNRLFDNFYRGTSLSDGGTGFVPAVDVEETPEGFVIRADLPGVSQKDVKVSVMGDTLTIRGERRTQTTHKDGSFHRTERVYGSFERSFTLGAPVRNEAVKAQYKDGVLEIHVPKAEEARLREIVVQVAQ
jgi:HSP20 family protein